MKKRKSQSETVRAIRRAVIEYRSRTTKASRHIGGYLEAQGCQVVRISPTIIRVRHTIQ